MIGTTKSTTHKHNTVYLELIGTRYGRKYQICWNSECVGDIKQDRGGYGLPRTWVGEVCGLHVKFDGRGTAKSICKKLQPIVEEEKFRERIEE